MACGGECGNCNGECHPAPGLRAEKDSCRTCPNRERCHGKKPDVTRETVMRLVRDAVIEVLGELETSRR